MWHVTAFLCACTHWLTNACARFFFSLDGSVFTSVLLSTVARLDSIVVHVVRNDTIVVCDRVHDDWALVHDRGWLVHDDR